MPRPRTKKVAFLSNGLRGPKGPKGTSMNGPPKGISIKTPGFPVDSASNGPVPESNIQELGLSLEPHSKNTLANRVKLRKEQALKNELKNELKNKNQKKRTLKDRKMEASAKNEAKFDKLFGNRHDKLAIEMNGMPPDLANELAKASRKAELSDYKAQRKLLARSKSNHFRGDRKLKRRKATNNVTQ